MKINFSKQNLGIFFALITALSLGAITTVAKISYDAGGSVFTLMLIRFCACSLVFSSLILLKRESFKITKPQGLSLFSIGFIWSVGMICYLQSVVFISISLAVMVLYSFPLLVLIHAIFTKQLRPSLSLIGLFVLAFGGICLMLFNGTGEVHYIGAAFAAIASFAAAYTFINGARIAEKLSPLQIVFWINLVGLIIIVPLVAGKISLPETSNGNLALAAATLFYLIAIVCQFQALSRLPAPTTAIILNLEPLISIFLASWLLSETLTKLQWVGISLVALVLLCIPFQASLKRQNA